MPAAHQPFLDRYRFCWLVFASVTVVWVSLVVRDLNLLSLTLFVAVVAALVWLYFAVFRLVVLSSPGDRHRSLVRVRWIAITLALAAALALLPRHPGMWIIATLSAAWLYGTNLLVSRGLSPQRQISLTASAAAYFFSDLWLVIVLAYLGLNWYLVAVLVAFSLCSALPLDDSGKPWFGLGASVLAAAFPVIVMPSAGRGFGVFLGLTLLTVGTTATVLTSFAARHAHAARVSSSAAAEPRS